MPAAEEVRPNKFQNLKVLFDNEWYSVISGTYDGGDQSVLGERWNGGEGSLGFPNVAGNPVWHVVPEFLAIPILEGLLDELAANPNPKSEEYSEKILQEIRTQHKRRCR
jgi:hypothetical protein